MRLVELLMRRRRLGLLGTLASIIALAGCEANGNTAPQTPAQSVRSPASSGRITDDCFWQPGGCSIMAGSFADYSWMDGTTYLGGEQTFGPPCPSCRARQLTEAERKALEEEAAHLKAQVDDLPAILQTFRHESFHGVIPQDGSEIKDDANNGYGMSAAELASVCRPVIGVT